MNVFKVIILLIRNLSNIFMLENDLNIVIYVDYSNIH